MNSAIRSLPGGFENEIIQAVSKLSVAAFPGQLRSVVLTGSLARDEGTWLNKNGRSYLAGDAEFLLVFKDRKLIAGSDLVKRLCSDAEARLADQGIDAQINLSAVEPEYLRRQQPHIFAYELISHGKVVWGDTEVLDLIPAFTSADIPLEDGFRTLLNRMTELLETFCEREDYSRYTNAVGYRATKLSLDMATSYLLFERIYESTYQGRALRLRELSTPSEPSPLPLSRFIERVQIATRRKLGDCSIAIPRRIDLCELIEDFHLLWRWELERLTSSRLGMSDTELIDRWAVNQQLVERLRGWASVATRYGIARSIGDAPRWIRRSLNGSPRRLLYAAASELMFAMPEILYSREPVVGRESRWDRLRMNLPVSEPPGCASACQAWRRLGLAIAWNYHHFLEFTRS